MLESTDGERLPWSRLPSGGKDVCRKCEGPAREGLRRLALVGVVLIDERFRGMVRFASGGEPAGGEDAMMA
jgi:hypothetical protein